MMKITPIGPVLQAAGLDSPNLNVLVPNEANYTALLMQPNGQIEANTAGVKNRNRELTIKQFDRFLDLAHEVQPDLAVTPEYSMPWDSILGAIRAGKVPLQGKLWAFGCESIKFTELQALRQSLAPYATMLFEDLQADSTRFADPLVYVFASPKAGNATKTRTVALVQFKTCTMAGDAHHFETNRLHLGSSVYQFGGGGSLRLLSLICSDAFAFDDENHAKTVYHQSFLIHVQLNRNPRHAQFRRYRDTVFGYTGDATEILCLNWAHGVQMWTDGVKDDWVNIAGSAWYLRPSHFDIEDDALQSNHQRGLYYTWLQSARTHALFFNYQQAVFQLTASKVAHVGVLAPKSYRRGPQLVKRFTWQDEKTAWLDAPAVDDGFSDIVGESDQARDELLRVAARNPFEAERILALCAGEIGSSPVWYDVRQLDSCVIDQSEVIRRITFCQDTDKSANGFRVARLKRCGRLWNILKVEGPLPPALAELRNRFSFEWIPESPHQNVISGKKVRATVIYMGEEVSENQVEATAKTVAEHLHRGSRNPDESMSSRQRLAVWFGRAGKVHLYEARRYLTITESRAGSEFDIGRAE